MQKGQAHAKKRRTNPILLLVILALVVFLGVELIRVGKRLNEAALDAWADGGNTALVCDQPPTSPDVPASLDEPFVEIVPATMPTGDMPSAVPGAGQVEAVGAVAELRQRRGVAQVGGGRLDAHDEAVLAVQLDCAAVHGGIDAQPLHHEGVRRGVSVVHPEGRDVLAGEDRVAVAGIKPVIEVVIGGVRARDEALVGLHQGGKTADLHSSGRSFFLVLDADFSMLIGFDCCRGFRSCGSDKGALRSPP